MFEMTVPEIGPLGIRESNAFALDQIQIRPCQDVKHIVFARDFRLILKIAKMTSFDSSFSLYSSEPASS
jgi:hypothetical protein